MFSPFQHVLARLGQDGRVVDQQNSALTGGGALFLAHPFGPGIGSKQESPLQGLVGYGLRLLPHGGPLFRI